MLTRLEADGFKNLLDFQVDFGPFNCVAGPNGVGKSNIFDAIRFLSLLSDHTLTGAALAVRGDDPGLGDADDLFWTDGRHRAGELKLAAEMLIEPDVTDDFGRAAHASSTFLRYEIRIARRRHGLELLHEELGYVTEGEAARHLRFPHSAADFRRLAVVNRRRRKAGFISTRQSADGTAEVVVHQDVHGAVTLAAAPVAATRTIVGTSSTAATPTILAARQEMARWRLLALEPTAMRRADRFHAPAQIDARGAHLPATLHRLIEGENGGGEAPDLATFGGALRARIAQRLRQLTPVTGLAVAVDPVRKLLTLEVTEDGGAILPARSLSDGTLRILALSIFKEDPEHRGLLCLEEPENGVHPGRFEAWVRLLKDLSVDPRRPPSPENPLRQVIVATHSPSFVQLVDGADLLIATRQPSAAPKARPDDGRPEARPGDERPATALHCRPLAGTWRARRGARSLSPGTALAYLTTPHGEQIQLPATFPSRGTHRG